jgi:hypothetical protein
VTEALVIALLQQRLAVTARVTARTERDHYCHKVSDATPYATATSTAALLSTVFVDILLQRLLKCN